MTVDTRDGSAALALATAFAEAVATESHGQTVVYVNAADWHPAVVMLRADHGYSMAVDITAVDHLGEQDRATIDGVTPLRYEVVANFLNLEANRRIRLIAPIDGEVPSIASLADLYPGLHNPGTRRVFDLLGISFEGHPELTRILLPDEWVGAPLRRAASARIPVTFKAPGGGQ